MISHTSITTTTTTSTKIASCKCIIAKRISLLNFAFENLPLNENKLYMRAAKGESPNITISFIFKPALCTIYGDETIQFFAGVVPKEVLTLENCKLDMCRGTVVTYSDVGSHEFSLRGSKSRFVFHYGSYTVQRKYLLTRIVEYHIGKDQSVSLPLICLTSPFQIRTFLPLHLLIHTPLNVSIEPYLFIPLPFVQITLCSGHLGRRIGTDLCQSSFWKGHLYEHAFRRQFRDSTRESGAARICHRQTLLLHRQKCIFSFS